MKRVNGVPTVFPADTEEVSPEEDMLQVGAMNIICHLYLYESLVAGHRYVITSAFLYVLVCLHEACSRLATVCCMC